ncbi:BON1-associated protein [Salix suchowensis]|nr:BON1-associated protein [Salix suchowensis]
MSSTSRPSSKPMQTYVVAYIDPMEKAVSRVDRTGNRNPTWNDKFVFSVDEDSSIGVVHVLLEDLLKINGKNCMAFLVRNPSGEPRELINLGAATLNGMFHEDLPKHIWPELETDGNLKTKVTKVSSNDFHVRKMRRTLYNSI